MNVEVNDKHIHVTLSKRNLEALLSKLNREGSQRTLLRGTGGYLLTVTAETNEQHYAEREPGIVHPLDVAA